VRQTDSIHTLNVSYLYYLNGIRGKIINEMSGNYTGNEQSCAVKLRAAVLGVADIACACNTHFNFPTLCTPETGHNNYLMLPLLSNDWVAYRSND